MRRTLISLAAAGSVWIAAGDSLADDGSSLPDLELFSLYQKVVESPAPDPADLAALLNATDDPAMQLDIARHLLLSDQPEAVIDLLSGLAAALPADQALRSEAFDLLSRAHERLGNHLLALDAGIEAYDAAAARLGPDNPVLLERLDALLDLARRHALPDLALLETARAELKERIETPERVRQLGKPVAVPVWFGTNRNDTGGPDPATRFGSERSNLVVGKLTVTIPPIHRVGVIEMPSAWGFTRHWDPMRHVVLADIEILTEEVFANGCCEAEDRLLFIHGYNLDFHDGALRAAQLAFDLEFPGQAMYFSWPSRGTLLGYLADANNVLSSRPALSEYLELATRGTGKLHIIAHSMGNRYLLEALEIFFRDHPERDLGHVVLGAPDVDRNELVVRLDILRDRADGVTLYASRNDRALLVSRRIHGAPRAGDSSGEPLRVAGLTTLDASEIDADLLGHSYFGDSPLVLGDLAGLIRLGLAPDNRCGTRERADPIWDLRPDGCAVDLVVTAGAFISQHGDGAVSEIERMQAEASDDDLDFWLGVLEIVRDVLPAYTSKSE